MARWSQVTTSNIKKKKKFLFFISYCKMHYSWCDCVNISMGSFPFDWYISYEVWDSHQTLKNAVWQKCIFCITIWRYKSDSIHHYKSFCQLFISLFQLHCNGPCVLHHLSQLKNKVVNMPVMKRLLNYLVCLFCVVLILLVCFLSCRSGLHLSMASPGRFCLNAGASVCTMW